ncbi:FAD-dependent monooxygenase [Desulfobacterota bacterium M19]
MDHFHTIIIGGGPAGLSCAAVIAGHGRRVIVLERHKRPGPKVCAGGIPWRARKELGLPDELIEGSFQTQHVYTPRQRAVLSSPNPIISTVNRERLGQWLTQKAREAGAVIAGGCPALSITATHVVTPEKRLSYKNLVGADGSASIVRRYLQLPAEKMGAGINFQIPRQLPHMEWHLNTARFNSGYAWIFPHRESSSVGIYAERHDLPPSLMEKRLRRWAAAQNINLKGCRARAALINFDYRGWNFGHVFLTGDAAGLASGFTGEGIYPAIISGREIARAIIDPHYSPRRMHRLINRHRRHQRMQKFFTGNKVICQTALEMIVLAMRSGLLDFRLLEMY